MAASVQSVVPASWDTRIDTLDAKSALKIALEGATAVASTPSAADGTLAQLCASRAMGEPDFVVQGRMDVSGETLIVLDFTARGVTFPAGFCRVIDIECFYTGDTVATESGYIHRREMIVGGTTPTLGIVIGAIDTNMAGAVGGFTGSDPTLVFALLTNNVQITTVNEGATEIVNVLLKAYVGKLVPVKLGV